jgi:branched-chain amino acid transport system permease protein
MFGNSLHALDSTIYGLMLVLFIIYMPKGILGGAMEALQRKKSATAGGGQRA